MYQTDFSAQLDDLLANVRKNTGYGAVYLDARDGALRTNQAACAFCRHCLRSPVTSEYCRNTYAGATQNAFASGEPFYYSCWAGLLFVAVALAPFRELRGGIAVGGFCPPGEEAQVRAGLSARLGGARRQTDLPRLLPLLPTLRAVTPGELRGIGAYLLEATMAGGINAPSFFRRQRAKYLQQRAIAEACRKLRPADLSASGLLLKAQRLAESMVRNDEEQAGRLSTAYLASLLQTANWDLGRLKAHLRVLLALITRNLILRDGDWAAVSNAEMRFIARLDQCRTVEDTCYLIAELVHQETRREPAAQTPTISERVIRWLELNYGDKVTLARAARAVGASTPSIGKYLRREMGKSFHQLLVETRIAEAKRLLATTNLEISAVSEMCGFCDQSHFTKQLQRAINLTPGQFRKLLKIPPEEVLK
jgi:AraC-like DNA-binding protein